MNKFAQNTPYSPSQRPPKSAHILTWEVLFIWEVLPPLSSYDPPCVFVALIHQDPDSSPRPQGILAPKGISLRGHSLLLQLLITDEG